MNKYHIPKGFFKCYESELSKHHKSSQGLAKNLSKHINEEGESSWVYISSSIMAASTSTAMELDDDLEKLAYYDSYDNLLKNMALSFKACAKQNKFNF